MYANNHLRPQVAFIVMLLSVLAGCSTLSKKECLEGDWYKQGHRDGSRGYKAKRVASHQKSCTKHGKPINLSEYRRGRKDGLLRFCTRDKGYNEGSSGAALKDVCSPSRKREFLSGYLAGIASAISHAELELQQAKWRYRRARRSGKHEKDSKKHGRSLDRLEREVDKKFDELRQLQQQQDKARFLYGGT